MSTEVKYCSVCKEVRTFDVYEEGIYLVKKCEVCQHRETIKIPGRNFKKGV